MQPTQGGYTTLNAVKRNISSPDSVIDIPGAVPEISFVQSLCMQTPDPIDTLLPTLDYSGLLTIPTQHLPQRNGQHNLGLP